MEPTSGIFNDRSVSDLLSWRARQTPRAIAYFSRSADRTWVPTTWSEYQNQVAALAARLVARGMLPGDRVAILLPTCPHWEMVHQAGLTIGATIVGLDPQASNDEIEWALNHVEANWLVLRSSRIASITLRRGKSLPGLIILDDPPGDRGADQAARASRAVHPRPSGGVESFAAQRTPDQVATILFTSGTTGTPKAIPYTSRQLLAACNAILRTYPELGEEDVTICWLPLSALFQRIINLCAITWGMTSYFLDDPRQILETLSEVSPSFLIGVPRFYQKLQAALRNCEQSPGDDWRRRVKFMITGSAPLAGSILQDLRARGVLVLEAYGVSENAVPMAANRLADYRFGSVGKPLPDNELRFAADGELLVRGPGLFSSYLGEPRPRDLFTDDGFYRTGDCGHLDEDGFLHLVGRKAAIIKTSTGRRISPLAIESVYQQSDYFQRVVVCGEGRTYLVALISLNTSLLAGSPVSAEGPSGAGASPSAAELNELVLRELHRLEAGLVPYKRVQAAAILPVPLSVERGELTSAGKLRRAVINSKYRHVLDALYRLPPPCVLHAGEWDASCTTETSP